MRTAGADAVAPLWTDIERHGRQPEDRLTADMAWIPSGTFRMGFGQTRFFIR
jgi:hypothetical protein